MKRKGLLSVLLAILLLISGCTGKDGGRKPQAGIAENGANAIEGEEADMDVSENRVGNDDVEAGSGALPKEYDASYWKYDLELISAEADFLVEEGEFFLSAQYYQGEGICFYGNAEGQLLCYHAAGGEKELLLEGLPESYLVPSVRWYRDSENFYVCQKESLIILDINGQQTYKLDAGGNISGICSTQSEDIALLVNSVQGSGYMVLTLDKEKSALAGRTVVQDFFAVSTGYESDILVMTWQGVYDLNLKNGEKVWHMKWEGTSYTTGAGEKAPCAFIMQEQGRVEQIASNYDGQFFVESLCKINPSASGKILLTYRTSVASSEEKQLIAQFNKENEEYYVVLEERGDMYWVDYNNRNSMEIAAGKGPDIITTGAVRDMSNLAERGALENLEPYLQESGIRREDYFSSAMQDLGMENGIYGVGRSMELSVLYIREDFVEDAQNTGLEELLDNMEACSDNVVLSSSFGYDSAAVLWLFLHMSDDLFGMVDWENKTCDFSGELWERMLSVAGKYGVTERNTGAEEISCMLPVRSVGEFARIEAESQSRGMTAVGYPVNGGMAARIFTGTIAINASSANKEGAWEFIEYLLSEEVQRQVAENSFSVNRKIFQEAVDKADKENVYAYNKWYPAQEIYITDESIATCLMWIEGARPEPANTQYILRIVQEEAAYYFAGDKNTEEVSATIENRVRLYLAEMD